MNPQPQQLSSDKLEPSITPDIIARFWAKVDKSGPIPKRCPERGPCWLWKASKNWKGYASFCADKEHYRSSAHRFSYRIHFGPVPKGLDVLHYCDNPECQNPNHLVAGTVQENNQYKIEGGRVRSALGEDCNHKLTENEVRAIRQIGNSQKAAETALMFNVCRHTIQRVIARKFWKHVT